MVDSDRARLSRLRDGRINRADEVKLTQLRHDDAGHNSDNRRVFRHVIRILLLVLVRRMMMIGVIIVVMRNRFRVMMMSVESPKYLVRVADGKKHYDEEQEHSAFAKANH